MDTFWGAFPPNSTVSGTSELFSSSVAMLGDNYQPYQEAWCEQQKAVLPVNFTPFFEQPVEVVPTSTHGAYMEHPAIYGNYDANGAFPVYHAEQMTQAQLAARHQAAQQVAAAAEEARQKEHYFAQKIMDSGIAGMLPAPVAISSNPHHTPDSGIGMITPSCRPSSVCGSDVPGRSPITSSESGIENDGSPGGSEVNPSDMEEGEGRVMCHACKGLYPSRRSLTGHIGRNEKCREIIGRTYIDQVAAGGAPIPTPDTNLRTAAVVSAMTNGQDGLSPICPHCDKFISHYKGNIRRHINTCDKNVSYKRSRPDKERERKRKRKQEVRPQAVLQEGFEPSSAFNPMLYPQQYQSVHQEDHLNQHAQQMHLHSSLNVTLPTDPSPPNPPKRDEPPDDAYICGLCDFVTIYKGNMKRHLNTCHKSNDCKDLKEWDRKLESMRASSLGMSREEMLQRLHLHRMNSTRGRKPGKRHMSHESHLAVQQQHPQPSMAHSLQSAPVHYQQQEQMVLPTHVPMTMMSQETEMFSMPQMQQVHYGYDMGGYMQ